MDHNELSGYLANYDVIVPHERKMNCTVVEQYAKRHNIEDLVCAKTVVTDLYPDYSDVFDHILNKKSMIPYNMFIMKKDYFDQYMEWLFSVLFELEKRTNYTAYDSYQARMLGFVSERLLDVWLSKNNPRVFKMNVLYFKDL